jgi:hypothetical protein
MKSRLWISFLAAALLGAGGLMSAGAAESPTVGRAADDQRALDSDDFASQVAAARLATAKYATDLDAAIADGYRIITPMMPDMGYHFLNPSISEFDVTKPPILVYVRDGDNWQLVAVEWVFPERPKKPPLPHAKYGSFGAACHYQDGSFVFLASEDDCPETSPESGAPFFFWHPDLVTLHVWMWYPNPAGIYNSTNPLIRPFNED